MSQPSPDRGSARTSEQAATSRLGDSGPAVAEIRGKLARLGLLESDVERSIPDLHAHFDQDCDRAVREFQQQRGLTVDGIVGSATYGALEEARWRLGDRILSFRPTHLMVGDDVAGLQRRLVELGFDAGRADGVFGEHTSARSVTSSTTSVCEPTAHAAQGRSRRSTGWPAPWWAAGPEIYASPSRSEPPVRRCPARPS